MAESFEELELTGGNSRTVDVGVSKSAGSATLEGHPSGATPTFAPTDAREIPMRELMHKNSTNRAGDEGDVNPLPATKKVTCQQASTIGKNGYLKSFMSKISPSSILIVLHQWICNICRLICRDKPFAAKN
ncbi:hypothetical protein Hanom_Chr03g00198001 [Helianthus anomalus]